MVISKDEVAPLSFSSTMVIVIIFLQLISLQSQLHMNLSGRQQKALRVASYLRSCQPSLEKLLSSTALAIDRSSRVSRVSQILQFQLMTKIQMGLNTCIEPILDIMMDNHGTIGQKLLGLDLIQKTITEQGDIWRKASFTCFLTLIR